MRPWPRTAPQPNALACNAIGAGRFGDQKQSTRSELGENLGCTQDAPTTQNGHSEVAVSVVLSGGPGAIRTPDPQIRSHKKAAWNELG